MKSNQQTTLMKKYTSNTLKFKMASDHRFIKVYSCGRLSGFIWNNSRKIRVNGDEVVSSDFFK